MPIEMDVFLFDVCLMTISYERMQRNDGDDTQPALRGTGYSTLVRVFGKIVIPDLFVT